MMQVLCDGTWCEFAAQKIGCSRGFGRGSLDSSARRGDSDGK